MYQQCREYLIEKLKAAGIKTEIHTNQKTLDADNESHKGAVIADSDEFERSGQKVNYKDQEGRRHKRIKKLSRATTFVVTIGEHSDDAAETIFEEFLRLVEPGIYIDDNHVPITLLPASWFDEEDKIIRSKVAVIMKVKFDGGVYQDADYLRVGTAMDAPEMERKEE